MRKSVRFFGGDECDRPLCGKKGAGGVAAVEENQAAKAAQIFSGTATGMREPLFFKKGFPQNFFFSFFLLFSP